MQYEIIHNALTVDLLVSMAYAAAAEGIMDDPLPIGLGLRVPLPPKDTIVVQPVQRALHVLSAPAPAPAPPVDDRQSKAAAGPDGLCEFDDMDKGQMRASIVAMINSLPSVSISCLIWGNLLIPSLICLS